MTTGDTIAIVGAGLTGSMMGLMLARHGYEVEIYEKRSDFRHRKEEEPTVPTSPFGASKDSSKRSINLALSHRGEEALKAVDLHAQVMEMCIPMYCRAIHLGQDELVEQAYGTTDQAIYSVSRNALNALLLSAAESYPNVTLHFDAVVSFEPGSSTTLNIGGVNGSGSSTLRCKKQFRLVVGADGAYSVVRSHLSRLVRQNFRQSYIPHGYKELTIPPTGDGDFALKPVEALHIWPRGNFMMIALPNPDKSFTCTLFAPYDGPGGFNDVETRNQVQKHFHQYFPDVLNVMPNYIEDYLHNPTGALATMEVNPWSSKDGHMLLIGDAAHAIVPFFGQGMNSGFEDCLYFMELLEASPTEALDEVVTIFAHCRRPQADALARLSLANYTEMRAHTASLKFRFRKRIEATLHYWFPSLWTPLYSMVSFSRVPYDQAIVKAQRQDKVLSGLTSSILLGVSALLIQWGISRVRK